MVAVIEALAARDRSRAKKQAETLKRHEQQRARLAAEAQPNNRKTHGMNSMPFGQCRICPEMYILLYSSLYLITKNRVPKDIKFGLMEEFG